MRALFFAGPGKLRFEETPDPKLEADTDAVIAPIAATTCDLDHGLIAGLTPFQGPFALGHECVGRVIEVGSACTECRPGDVVAIAWHIACGRCAPCESRFPARCEPHWNAQYGLPVRGDWGGTFSERVRVPYADFNTVKLPDGVDPVHLASVGDNQSLGWEVVVPYLEGVSDPSVVILGGGGSIGLYAVDAAVNVAGAKTVYFDPSPERLAIAEKLGAEVREGPPPKRIGEFHLAVDASVNPDWLRSGLRSVVPEGQVNSVGIYFEPVALDLFDQYVRCVNFHTGKGHARSFMPDVLRASAEGTLHPELVTSGIYAWDELPEVLTNRPGHKPIFVLD